MESDAGAKLERPLFLVVILHGPFGRKPGNHDARLVGRREVPHRQRVVHGQAGEAIAFKTLIGLAQRARNIGRGHADAQNGFGAGALRGNPRRVAIASTRAAIAPARFPDFR